MKKLFYFLIIIISVSCSKDDENPSFEEQLAIDIAIIDDYLIENSISTEDHSSGIKFINVAEGDGDSPTVGDRIAIKAQFTLLNETVLFNDTLGLTVTLDDQIIEALRIMAPTIKEGGKIKFFSPSGYCFGPSGSASIPSNSNLIFTVELLKVIKNEEDQLAADLSIIDEYISERNIRAEEHNSGIHFVTKSSGIGNFPSASDNVIVNYKGSFLNGNIFDQSVNPVQFRLEGLIEAWQIMIPTIREGGSITIYCPSQYCYGTTGTNTIAPNSILIFEIDLESIN